MRRTISLFIILTLLVGVIFSGEVREFINASIEANNNLGLAKSDSTLLVAFQGVDDYFYLVRQEGEAQRVAQGNFNKIVAQGDLVVIGYERSRQPFVVVSYDGGLSFERPIALTGTGQDATIQDIVIDGEGVIHVVFHRHNRYWDYNYSRSSDGGRSFKTKLGFTRQSDSNSTGYSSALVGLSGNLYTLYQDNNDKFAIKLGLSKDGGETWQIKRLTSTPGGRLDLALNQENLAYMAALNGEGLSLYKINGPSSNNPTYWPLYIDESVKPVGGKNLQVDLVIGDDNTLVVTYLDPANQSYHLLTSLDLGETWQLEVLGDGPNPAVQEYKSALFATDGELYFAHLNKEGRIILHTISSTVPQYRTDEMGFVKVDKVDPEFELLTANEIVWLTFSVGETGNYEINHLTHPQYETIFFLFNLTSGSDETLADNFVDFEFVDSLFVNLVAGNEYVMVVAPLIEVNETIALRFQMKAMVPKIGKGPKLTPIEGVTAGSYTSFYLDKEGRLFGAGLNDQGQLGDSVQKKLGSFTQLRNDVARLYSGFGHTLYLTYERKLYVSGRNEDYQIGDGTQEPRKGFYMLASNVIDAAAGYGHTLYILEDGSVWTVGANNQGQLGEGTTERRLKPIKVFEGAKRVYAGFGSSSYIVTKGGELYGFGENSNGQLGLGHTNSVTKPTFITNNVKDVAVGMNYLMVLKTDNTLWGVGANSNGQLGTKDQTNRQNLTKVASDVSKVATGNYTTYYIDLEGRLYGSGSNQYGQFGLGSTQNRSLKEGFIYLLDDVEDVDSGRSHTVLLTKDGRILTAGLNDNGQLGDSTEGFRLKWREVFRAE